MIEKFTLAAANMSRARSRGVMSRTENLKRHRCVADNG
jgi:hypothetical protein